jgi:hypothetical protein
MDQADPDPILIAALVDRLVDEQRVRCLWDLRHDWYPATDEARIRALRRIEQRGDREAFREAATLRRWLSRHSSAGSAAS